MQIAVIALAIDCEMDGDVLLEVGVCEFDWRSGQILRTMSLPLTPPDGFIVRPEIEALTGWNAALLRRRGVSAEEVSRRLLEKYGARRRLLVTDAGDEIPGIEKALGVALSPERMNVSLLHAMVSGSERNISLEEMLADRGLAFEGTPHRADSDAHNIARLFVALAPALRDPAAAPRATGEGT